MRNVPHEHRHTILKIPRTNAAAIGGASVLSLVTALLMYLLEEYNKGNLTGVVPISVLPYLPIIFGIVGVVVIWFGTLGTPSLHPDVPLTKPHYGPLEHHD